MGETQLLVTKFLELLNTHDFGNPNGTKNWCASAMLRKIQYSRQTLINSFKTSKTFSIILLMGAGLSWQPNYLKEIECLWQHLLTAVCSLPVVCVTLFLAIGKTSKLRCSQEHVERGPRKRTIEEGGERKEGRKVGNEQGVNSIDIMNLGHETA